MEAPGLVQPAKSTTTQVVAKGVNGLLTSADGPEFAISVNFGFEEFNRDFTKTRTISVTNNGSSSASFGVAVTNQAGSPHSVALSTSSLTVPAGGTVDFTMRLTVPVATAGNSDDFREVAGMVTLTPTAGSNNDVTLRVPYYLVPRAQANVKTTVDKLKGGATSTTARISNSKGGIRPRTTSTRGASRTARSRPARRRTTSAPSACSRSRSRSSPQLSGSSSSQSARTTAGRMRPCRNTTSRSTSTTTAKWTTPSSRLTSVQSRPGFSTGSWARSCSVRPGRRSRRSPCSHRTTARRS